MVLECWLWSELESNSMGRFRHAPTCHVHVRHAQYNNDVTKDMTPKPLVVRYTLGGE